MLSDPNILSALYNTLLIAFLSALIACIIGTAASIAIHSMKPVSATVTILNAVSVFNDFMNPLYFLPGSKNVTLQLTLYSFIGQFSSSYHLLFADVILIVLPMLILFFILNDRIVDGMTAGAVKG